MRNALIVASALAVAASARAEPVLPPPATGDLYVSSFGTDEVHCYASDGSFRFRFGHADLDGPRGLVFFGADELHVASERTDRILVFDAEGTYRRQYTGGGLDQPTSLARDGSGRLYAASFGTHEVLVFQDGAYETKFTAEGLRGPNCVALAETGDLYVASQLTNEVYRFDGEHRFVSRFTGGGLASPMGIAIYGGEVYVAGGASHTIAVFDFEGRFLRNIERPAGDPALNGPQGIAFDDEGRLAVSSFYTGRVGLFSREGGRALLFDESGVETGRSVAYRPLSLSEAAFVRGDYSAGAGIDIADPIALLDRLFRAAPPTGCEDAGDANDDGDLDVSDPIYLLLYLFGNGPSPPPPFPDAGSDPTPDALRCLDGG